VDGIDTVEAEDVDMGKDAVEGLKEKGALLVDSECSSLTLFE
jgi:hypothetical protein